MATASTLQTRPMTGSRFRSTCRVRSGLTAFQLFPRSSLRKTLCAANQSRVGEWGEIEERRVPVPAQGRVARPGLRLDVDLLARLPVEPHEGAVLRLGVDDVGVARLDRGEEAVAPLRDEPVLVPDAVDVVGPRRPAEGGVVLRAAVDVVEGLRVVDRDPVELRHREVRLELPRRAAVPRLVDAAVVAVQEVVGVLRVDPEGVVVDVLGLLARLAATSSRRRPSPACRCPSSRRGSASFGSGTSSW